MYPQTQMNVKLTMVGVREMQLVSILQGASDVNVMMVSLGTAFSVKVGFPKYFTYHFK